MKVFLFKYSVSLVYVLSATVFVLFVATYLLYTEKSKMQNHNHVLILQNDSILAEHIRQKNAILQEQISSPQSKAHLSAAGFIK